GVGRAIALGDATAIKAAPGVGPKIAARVVNELKDKAPKVMALGGALQAEATVTEVVAAPSGEPATAPAPAVSRPDGSAAMQADALSALLNLGYGQGEAAGAVAQAAGADTEADTAALIRSALKLLAPGT
ncbi:MAG: Holliday junction branch migration protein RuvA, partial [Pseudomonadota bacterium]